MSLHHALARRSARFSPARTSDPDCLSPSLMFLDAGDVDLTSHTLVPTVSVQPYVQSDDLHARAVSSQSSSIGETHCIRSLSCDSCAPVTLCGLFPGLVESKFPDESQTQWSSAVTDTVLCHARSLTNVTDRRPDYLNSEPLPDAKRPSRVSPSQKSVIRCPTPKGGTLYEKSDECPRVSRSWPAKLCEFKASPLAKKRTAEPATNARQCWCRNPHG